MAGHPPVGRKRRQSDQDEAIPFREKYLGIFQYSWRAIELVWTTNRTLTLLFGILTLVAGLMPASLAYVGKLIVDQVLAAAKPPGGSRSWRRACAASGWRHRCSPMRSRSLPDMCTSTTQRCAIVPSSKRGASIRSWDHVDAWSGSRNGCNRSDPRQNTTNMRTHIYFLPLGASGAVYLYADA